MTRSTRSSPPSGVAPVHDHLGAVAGELQGDRATDAGRRAGHECPLILEATVLSD
jgi:hypothetical protein